MKIEVAVTAPGYAHPNSVYLKRKGEFGDTFYRAGYTNHASKSFLTENDAQFHTIDIPDWGDPRTARAIKDLSEIANEFDDQWEPTMARRVRAARDLIAQEVTGRWVRS